MEGGDTVKRIYIAGPYSSPDGYEGEDRNTMVAAEVSARYLKDGWAVFCPHTMTRDIARNFAKELTWEDWLTSDLAWIAVCDAIYMLPGWKQSKGAQYEYMVATALGLEILGERR